MSTEAFKAAARAGNLDRVNQLLHDPSVDVSSDDNLAIIWACENDHLSVVNRLLEDNRVDPAAGDNYAIQWASFRGHLSVVDRLLQDERVDPSAYDNRAIRFSSQSDNITILDHLLQHPRVNATCLHTHPYVDTNINTPAAAEQLSLPAVQRLSATLTLPFPADSRILNWQPRIRAYRAEAVALADDVVDWWRARGSGGGVSVEVMDDVVWRYCFGMRLHEYRELQSSSSST
jgi:ankyrin repeat protein